MTTYDRIVPFSVALLHFRNILLTCEMSLYFVEWELFSGVIMKQRKSKLYGLALLIKCFEQHESFSFFPLNDHIQLQSKSVNYKKETKDSHHILQK